jgi:hypothetical protein
VWDVAARTGTITELAEQLVKLAIDKVTVESTSDYWRIWYYLLEDAGLDVQLVKFPGCEERARSAQNRPVDRTTEATSGRVRAWSGWAG